MFWHHRNLRLATAVLLLVATGASGIAAVYTATGRCFAATVAAPPSGCATSANCCCGDSPVRACVCARHDEPTKLPLPVIPDDDQRVMKWAAAGQNTWAVSISPTLRHQAFAFADWLDFSPVERSIQSRLCIWRC